MLFEDMVTVYIRHKPLILDDERRHLQIMDQQIGVEASFCALHALSIDAKLMKFVSDQQCVSDQLDNSDLLRFTAGLFDNNRRILRERSLGDASGAQ